MPKVVALLVTTLCFWPCASHLVGDVPKAAKDAKVINYQAVAERLPWRWSDREASLTWSVTHHLTADEFRGPTQGVGFWFVIPLKAGPPFQGHSETVFTRWGDRLYLADFSPIATGCRVVAVNFKTGGRLWQNKLKGLGPIGHALSEGCAAASGNWQNKLKGLGPIGHSKYRNRINITTDGKIITVWGNEAAGRYVELLDKQTGRTVGHKVFAKD
ncbi:MAG TPA: hypothetical protein VEL76_04480 [Gemmataceae bacterium]|nr:hypothetical protein [Gemmataceae bacterium]